MWSGGGAAVTLTLAPTGAEAKVAATGQVLFSTMVGTETEWLQKQPEDGQAPEEDKWQEVESTPGSRQQRIRHRG